MTGSEAGLAQMLARREARAREQEALREKYSGVLVSFSMNIPGPIKTNSLIFKAFELGRNQLMSKLAEINARILEAREVHEVTGDELLLAVDGAGAGDIKDTAMSIEDSSPAGRLYDIDVIDAQGHKLSRERFRKCLICDKQAQECARSRTHSVIEMQEAVTNMLTVIM